MFDLLFVIALTVWSAGLGLRLLRALALAPEHPADALALAVPIGLGLLALATLGLGEIGHLDRAGLGIVLLLGACLAGSDAPRAIARLAREPRRFERDPIDLGLMALLAIVVVGTLLTALAPVTDGDALCYHLQVPKVFLATGSVGFEPDLHETIYPLVTEMLYAVALAFRGPVACRLVEWMIGLVFAANATALARPSLGDRAWWAGAIALLVPAISNGMSAPLNDVALAAFGTAAIVAWSRFDDRPSLPAAALLGLLTGFAVGVKYPALVLAGLLAGAVVFSSVRRVTLIARAIPSQGISEVRVAPGWPGQSEACPGIPGPDTRGTLRFAPATPEGDPTGMSALRGLAVFATVAFLVGAAWYLRAFVHTGNPVFPFFRHVFGGAGLDEVLDPIKRPLAVNVGNLLTALVPLTLAPDRFDSFSHQFGPVFLLFLPALLFEKAPRRVLAIIGIGYTFLTLCLTQRQSMRFVLIAVGPLSVGVAWLAVSWRARWSWPARGLLALLFVCLAFEATFGLARARHGLNVVLGRETTEHYLSRREPTYHVGRWVDEHLPRDARLVGQDHRGFYIPRPYTMELAHRRRTGLGQHGEPPSEIVDRLLRAGFTHLLLCPPVPEDAVEFDPTLGRCLAPWLARRAPMFEQSIADADGVVRRYTIYDLARPQVEEARR